MIIRLPKKFGRVAAGGAALLIFGSCVTAVVVIGAPAKTPPDSFLTRKVYTVDQLLQQIQANPSIREHYAEQFHVPQDKLITYLRNNVVESYVQETGKYTVYCVRPNGYIYPTVQHFSKGTKVFALRNGEPVMKWLCGNPLMKFLPAVHEKVVTKKIPVTHKVLSNVETIVPAQPVQEVVPVEEVAPVYQPRVPIFAVPGSATNAVITGATHSSLLPLLPIAILPVIGHGGGHGSTSGSPTPGTTGGPTTGTTGGPTTGTTGGVPTSGTSGGPTTGTTGGPTTGTTGGPTTGTTGGPTTTTGTTSTTVGSVPEPASGSVIALGFIPLAIGALIASKRRPAVKDSKDV